MWICFEKPWLRFSSISQDLIHGFDSWQWEREKERKREREKDRKREIEKERKIEREK